MGPGDVYTILASSAETNGDYIALEALVPPDGGPPLHIHHDQIETFFILEGEMEITVGGQVYEAKAGDFVHVSKNTPHCFKNRSRTATKMVFTFVPAGDIEETDFSIWSKGEPELVLPSFCLTRNKSMRAA